MTRTPRRLLLLAGVAICAVIGASRAQAATSPSALVLKTTELPNGMVRYQAGFVTNAAIEQSRHLTAAQLSAYGRITGYEQSFRRNPSLPGIAVLQNEVVQFKNAAGAHRYFQNVVKQRMLASKDPQVKGFKVLSTRVGNESLAITYKVKTVSYADVEMRHGVYLGTVVIIGYTAKMNPAAISPLATAQDAHLGAAH